MRLLSCENFQPKLNTFVRIGLSYAKLQDVDPAVLYLTVATELNRAQYNPKNDFTELIGQLRGWISEYDKKPYVSVSLTEFETSKRVPDVLHLRKISKLVTEQLMSIDEACMKFGMSLEEANLVKLEYARFNYQEGQEKIGDKLLKAVEKSEHKDKRVIALLREIRANKQLYKSKGLSENPQYVLRIPIGRIS